MTILAEIIAHLNQIPTTLLPEAALMAVVCFAAMAALAATTPESQQEERD